MMLFFVQIMAGCYIIYSKKLNRFYIGSVHAEIEKRIHNHNINGYGENCYTAKANDWTLFMFIECVEFKEAVQIERHIKKMKSKVYIKYIIEKKHAQFAIDNPTWFNDLDTIMHFTPYFLKKALFAA